LRHRKNAAAGQINFVEGPVHFVKHACPLMCRSRER
jgi:hypothetical protein